MVKLHNVSKSRVLLQTTVRADSLRPPTTLLLTVSSEAFDVSVHEPKFVNEAISTPVGRHRARSNVKKHARINNDFRVVVPSSTMLKVAFACPFQ